MHATYPRVYMLVKLHHKVENTSTYGTLSPTNWWTAGLSFDVWILNFDWTLLLDKDKHLYCILGTLNVYGQGQLDHTFYNFYKLHFNYKIWKKKKFSITIRRIYQVYDSVLQIKIIFDNSYIFSPIYLILD